MSDKNKNDDYIDNEDIDKSQTNPFTWTKVEYIQAIPTNTILDHLPPELRKEIEKDMKKGKAGVGNTHDLNAPHEKIKYDFNMVNSNTDLKDFVKKLKKSKVKNYGILLYGVSGSGKSYLGEYLAQELHMPFIKKRASDMYSKYIGDSEKNIAEAFKEAKKKQAVLLIDEADSFLQDRKYAKQEYTVSSVNEMLTQMENHPYPFIMTTNLKSRLDPASMRRFIFKVKFEYMTKDNIQAGVKNYFGKKYKLKDDQLEQLTHLTAGDFKVAKRKLEILENNEYDNDMIFKYLLAEQSEKNIVEASKSVKL
jgi:SpoVK/Ycf46/Vps4 family AAA+-type ATPase